MEREYTFGHDKDDLDDKEEITEGGNEEAETVIRAFDNIADKLSSTTRGKLGEIINLIEKFYNEENEDWQEFLTDVNYLISEFVDASGPDELEEAETDAEEELIKLQNEARKLSS